MKSFCSCLFSSFLFLICVKSTNAQPKGIHLSWSGNIVNTSGAMAITWMNDKNDKGFVMYGTDSISLNKRTKAVVTFVDALSSYINKATLKKLLPGTFYYYRVGSDENGWSQIYKFRTGTANGDTNKIVIGIWSDTQNNDGNYNFEQTDTMVKQLSNSTYHFTIHCGDIVENGSVAKSWKDLFNVTEPLNANYPFMPVTGNHDVVNDTSSLIFQKPFPVFYQLMNLPHDQLNYSYDYGKAHFVAINSGWAEGAAKVNKVLFEKKSDEYNWLEKDLKKARKNKRIKWIILYSHYPVYSFGFSHIPTWQSHIKSLVDKYKVDLYLAGHRHVYERHKAVRGSEIFELANTNEYINPKGRIYITNGSCGGNLTGTGGQNLPTMIYTPKEKIYTYAVMTIEGNTLNYKVFDKRGRQIDYFQITRNND